jgi:ferredoxin
MARMLMVKVSLDSELCAGHGRCYTLAPDVYESDDEGRGRVIVAELEAAHAEAARLGARSCPERAITICE